jgi:hypothetical protein
VGPESGRPVPVLGTVCLTSAEYTADFIEVRDYGSATSTVRSADQTSYALFWYEPSAVGWNRLARTALAIRPKNIWKTARMFALLNMALADGYVASFDSKYTWQSGARSPSFPRRPPTRPDTARIPAGSPASANPDQSSAHAAASCGARCPHRGVRRGPGKPMTMTAAVRRARLRLGDLHSGGHREWWLASHGGNPPASRSWTEKAGRLVGDTSSMRPLGD